MNSDPLNIRCSVQWISCKQELDKINLELCRNQLTALLHKHIPDEKHVQIFHINNNHFSTQITEPCSKTTNKMVFQFLASIYQYNILASLLKYILIQPIIKIFEASLLMPEKNGIFYIMCQRLYEIIFENVLLALNGSKYDNYVICNSLITIQSNFKQKIKLFKKGSSIWTIILINSTNISRYYVT